MEHQGIKHSYQAFLPRLRRDQAGHLLGLEIRFPRWQRKRSAKISTIAVSEGLLPLKFKLNFKIITLQVHSSLAYLPQVKYVTTWNQANRYVL